MYAVEFQANITDGIIEVPETYRHQLAGAVRVIILTDQPASGSVTGGVTHSEPDMIAQLLAHPRKVAHFTPLKRDEIYERK